MPDKTIKDKYESRMTQLTHLELSPSHDVMLLKQLRGELRQMQAQEVAMSMGIHVKTNILDAARQRCDILQERIQATATKITELEKESE